MNYITSVRTQDAVLKICQEQWMIGMYCEGYSGNFVLSVQLDDEDDDDYFSGLVPVDAKFVKYFDSGYY